MRTGAGPAGVNWAGSYVYAARALHRPTSLDELRRIVAAAPRIRALGTRHSFSDIADAAEVVSLERMPGDIVVDRGGSTVTVGGGVTYADVAVHLHRHGLALHALASLPHLAVAGAVATASHGSGDRAGNLATAVAAIELVTSGGDVVVTARGDRDFDGTVVHLGALGVVTRLTLEVEQAYAVRQQVFTDLPWDVLLAELDLVLGAGDSVSVFTRWEEVAEQVWVKTRLPSDDAPRHDLCGARAAAAPCHPIAGMDPASCTAQLASPGPWWDRLPHFRAQSVPSRGAELQSEVHVPRSAAIPALAALLDLGPRLRPALLVSELRSVAADALWLSPQHERDTVAIHFTWKRQPEQVLGLVADVEAALAPFHARPHWGKLLAADAATIAQRYPRLGDFHALAQRLDPRGAFRNDWFERHLGRTG